MHNFFITEALVLTFLSSISVIYLIGEGDFFNFKNIKLYISIIFIGIIFAFCYNICKIEKDMYASGVGIIFISNIFWFLLLDNDITRFVNKNYNKFKINILRNFHWETGSNIIHLMVEKGWSYIYCLDKKSLDISVISEIENSDTLITFMNLLYDNFYEIPDFSFENFIDFAKNNRVMIKKYKLNLGNFNKIVIRKMNFMNFVKGRQINTKEYKLNIKNIGKVLRQYGISVDTKKININTATEQEITNLPLINIVMAKRIKKHIEEDGEFSSFWEFADFVGITPSQGIILTKFIFIQKTKNKEKIAQHQITERNVDL